MPQYTLTLDGQTLKSGQIQYKIENSANLMASPPQAVHKTLIQEQQAVDEFLKLKQKPVNSRKVIQASSVVGPKSKKPKINLIVQTTPQKPEKPQLKTVISPPPKQFGTVSMLNTPKQQQQQQQTQIQIQNNEKLQSANQTSPTKQFILPIMVRNDVVQRNAITSASNTTSDASQLFTQAFAMSNNNQNITIGDGKANSPFTYFQMKIQPNADGQLTLTPAPVQQATQQLQLSLSPQQLQQLSFQASSQNHQQQIQVQTQQIQQIQQSQPPAPIIQEQIDSQTQTTLQEQKHEEEPEESFDDEYEDEYFEIIEQGEEDEYSSLVVEKPPSPVSNKMSTKTKVNLPKATKSAKISKSRDDSLTMLQTVQQQHSEMGQKQLESLVTHSNKREIPDADKNLNLTVCNVCQKVFKRKEFLMQHLKSHIGLRPFKCETTGCNKSFSRKEHLLRHENSHTGSKSFSCNICQKKFSRKDNLNKHRR